MANKTAPMRRQSSFSAFMHNESTGTYLGKSPEHWRKILFFYLCYYSMCVGLFAIVYSVMISTLPERSEGPKIQIHLERPYLNAIPKGFSMSLSDPESYADDVALIDKFFFDFNVSETPNSADFPAECLSSPYGFPNNPCVFLRFNRIFDYRIPAGRGAITTAASVVAAPSVSPAIFPLVPPNVYTGQSNYRDPLVALQFQNIQAFAGVGSVAIQVDCDPVDAGNADEGCFNEIDVIVSA